VTDSDQIAHSDVPGATGKGRPVRRMFIGGVVALLAIAGVAVVGAQAAGSRSGSAYSGLTCSKTGTAYTQFASTSGYTSVTYSWFDSSDSKISELELLGGGSFRTITPTNADRVEASLAPYSSGGSTANATCS